MDTPRSTRVSGAKPVPHRRVLTDMAIKTADVPQTGAATLWDASLKHFGVRVSQGGTKSFIVLLGSGRRQVIGHYPVISLAQARTKAKLILAERTLGKHAPSTASWKAATAQFFAFAEQRNRPRTAFEYRRTLTRYFPFGTTRVADITKADIARKLDKLAGTPSQQSHALVIAKIFFNWAIKRGYLDINPCMAAVRAKSTPRARVLSDAELTAIWKTCSEPSSELSAPFRTIVKLLMLTGQRRGEIAALDWAWIDEHARTISFPAAITKNGRPHTVPFGSLTFDIFESVASGKLLFQARGKQAPFNGWSKSKAQLDKLSGVSGWTLHDLRRTFATRLAEFGVQPHIVERLLNHVTGTLSPIALVYNKAAYLEEMRAAIDRWDAHLRRLLR